MNTDNLCKQCGENIIATKLSDTLCYNCYQATKGETKKKQSEAAKNRHKREREEKKRVAVQSGRQFEYGEYEPSNILCPRNFDLESEYRKIQAINLSSEGENYNEKFTFALWLTADALARQPQTQEACAAILGVHKSLLTKWNQGGQMWKIRSEAQDFRTKYWGKELWRMRILEEMRDGDKDARKSFEKYYLDKDSGVVNDDRFTTPEDVEEADMIILNSGRSPNGEPSAASRKHTDQKIGERLIQETPVSEGTGS